MSMSSVIRPVSGTFDVILWDMFKDEFDTDEILEIVKITKTMLNDDIMKYEYITQLSHRNMETYFHSQRAMFTVKRIHDIIRILKMNAPTMIFRKFVVSALANRSIHEDSMGNTTMQLLHKATNGDVYDLEFVTIEDLPHVGTASRRGVLSLLREFCDYCNEHEQENSGYRYRLTL
jgi:hypothetical protein